MYTLATTWDIGPAEKHKLSCFKGLQHSRELLSHEVRHLVARPDFSKEIFVRGLPGRFC